MRLDHSDVIHTGCPEGHRFQYVTSRGFGWCRECRRHFPATLKAEAA